MIATAGFFIARFFRTSRSSGYRGGRSRSRAGGERHGSSQASGGRRGGWRGAFLERGFPLLEMPAVVGDEGVMTLQAAVEDLELEKIGVARHRLSQPAR